ncbi:hypothetical protein PV08_11090 [Exophiala spinifera]|uniref:Uncharacterized protein n=1 Tax=Exophiala spinifera TaxID=91928 RepID=A0A0D2AUG5_9EURO|nr:uncharacterized protein PV08_11090 [Exophiala spinifera]KIW10130.1 hypothetical protein PV08_11090 [Exophiala spinifera]
MSDNASTKAFKIAPPNITVCAFVVSPNTSQTTSCIPSSPPPPSPRRPVSPRSYQSNPIPIKSLPDSSHLLSGPGLSPPPPVRFRVLGPPPSSSSIFAYQHKRARSAPTSTTITSLGSFAVLSQSSSAHYTWSSTATSVPSNNCYGHNSSSSYSHHHNHNRTNSAPELTTPLEPTTPIQDAIQLRDSDHRDHPVRGAGDSGIRHLRGTEPSQSLCQEGKGTRRRRGVNAQRAVFRKVRFKLDDHDGDDTENDPIPDHRHKTDELEEDDEEEEHKGQRTVSGLLRFEDDRHSWF